MTILALNSPTFSSLWSSPVTQVLFGILVTLLVLRTSRGGGGGGGSVGGGSAFAFGSGSSDWMFSGLEGMTAMTAQHKPATSFHENTDIYDDFYAAVHDQLVFRDTSPNLSDMQVILSIDTPVYHANSIVVDVGCGTGKLVNALRNVFSAKQSQTGAGQGQGQGQGGAETMVFGVDISPSMIRRAIALHPGAEYMTGDAMDRHLFPESSVTHVLCVDYTFYLLKNRKHFVDNVLRWLMPGGYFIVHLVDKQPGLNRWHMAPVVTDRFRYSVDWKPALQLLREKFVFANGDVRTQHLSLPFQSMAQDVAMIQEVGFLLHAHYKLPAEGEYITVFTKQNYH